MITSKLRRLSALIYGGRPVFATSRFFLPLNTINQNPVTIDAVRSMKLKYMHLMSEIEVLNNNPAAQIRKD